MDYLGSFDQHLCFLPPRTCDQSSRVHVEQHITNSTQPPSIPQHFRLLCRRHHQPQPNLLIHLLPQAIHNAPLHRNTLAPLLPCLLPVLVRLPLLLPLCREVRVRLLHGLGETGMVLQKGFEDLGPGHELLVAVVAQVVNLLMLASMLRRYDECAHHARPQRVLVRPGILLDEDNLLIRRKLGLKVLHVRNEYLTDVALHTQQARCSKQGDVLDEGATHGDFLKLKLLARLFHPGDEEQADRVRRDGTLGEAVLARLGVLREKVAQDGRGCQGDALVDAADLA
jgi:hypothetical protein